MTLQNARPLSSRLNGRAGACDNSQSVNDSLPPGAAMSKTITQNRTKTETKVQRPRLHKVLLFNDDYTPRDFVVEVLKAVFRLNESQALNVMLTAHKKGVCVVAVFAQDIAETKAQRGTEAGAARGYPLRFGTEPEE